MDSDEPHELVSLATSKDSIKGLSSKEGAEVIDSLVRAGGRVTRKRKSRRYLPANVAELRTPKQARFITGLEKELGWQDDTERIKGLINRSIKKEVVRTKQEAINKVTEGLKTAAERESKKEVVENGASM